MPKRLPARWQPESIREFRASARQRFEDGLALAGRGHRTGAIYLWGYSAEMTLKAAYFRLTGLAETEVITWGGHILPAIDRGRNVLGIAWLRPGQGHNVRAWAELLVAERAAMPGAAYVHPFGQEVQACGQSVGQLWSEALRYHKNLAYLYEMNQVREAAAWLLVNAHAL
ncbi:MAG TPA: hypothetical protein VJ739_02490 [Gemmataceae bacterium]|nr:hypothetical protein [Gemmataceae bacterium]